MSSTERRRKPRVRVKPAPSLRYAGLGAGRAVGQEVRAGGAAAVAAPALVDARVQVGSAAAPRHDRDRVPVHVDLAADVEHEGRRRDFDPGIGDLASGAAGRVRVDGAEGAGEVVLEGDGLAGAGGKGEGQDGGLTAAANEGALGRPPGDEEGARGLVD